MPKVRINISEEKLGDLIRLLDRNQSPETGAMLLGAELEHQPDSEEEKPESEHRTIGVSF